MAQAVAAHATDPRRMSASKGRSRPKPKQSDDDDDDGGGARELPHDDDSEDEPIGQLADQVSYMREVLERMVEQMGKPPYLQPNGEPQYVLTAGDTGPGKEYVKYDGEPLASRLAPRASRLSPQP